LYCLPIITTITFAKTFLSILKKKVLSIIDIAGQLGISQSTVSFILNGKAKERRISDATTQRVLKFVEEVGYKPNLLARSFRTGKTNIIGLMVESIANPFFANLARLIEENAYKNGYKILYCSTENDSGKARELMHMFKDRHVDGYIIIPTEGIRDDVNKLAAGGASVILFDRCFEGDAIDYVVLDNFNSTYNATKHLIDQGYKNIGFVTISSLQSQMQQRLAGYEKALDDHSLQHYVKEVGFYLDTNTVVDYIVDFILRKKKLDAVIFATNYLGVSGLKAIKKAGLAIPDDLAVVCYDDLELFELHTPRITSIAQPIQEMSEQLINILLDKLASKNSINHKVTLPGKLIIRESSPKIARRKK
jgi:LacI family transcriptional regulator